MRAVTWLVVVSAVLVSASAVPMPRVSAQQPAAAAPAAPVVVKTPAEIKQELEKIKKTRTWGIIPSVGTDDSGGMTLLRVDNTSAFTLIVLIVGPTIERIELGPEGTQTLDIEPGQYEIAVTAVGRNIPSFYGTQRVVANMRFRHQFVVPAI